MHPTSLPSISVSIDSHIDQLARQLAMEQITPQQSKQIYLNTLAVRAVATYLGWLDIETTLDQNYSLDPRLRDVFDVADLIILGAGRIECRPVLPEQESFFVPYEVAEEDRIGYVAVQFNRILDSAELLGFISVDEVIEFAKESGQVPLCELQPLDDLLIPLSELQPLDTLLDCLPDSVFTLEVIEEADKQPSNDPLIVPNSENSLEEVKSPNHPPRPPNSISLSIPNLQPPKDWYSRFIEQMIAAGWERFLSSNEIQAASAGKNSNQEERWIKQIPGIPARWEGAAKLIEGDQFVEIQVKLIPHEDSAYLPPNLQASLITDEGEIWDQVFSEEQESTLVLEKYFAKPGSRFTLQAEFAGSSVTKVLDI